MYNNHFHALKVRKFSDGGGVHQRLLVHDSVETVNGIGGVLYSTPGAVGVHQRVATLDDIPGAVLDLALGVAGQTVLHVVSVLVLWVRVVLVGDHRLGDGHGGGGVRGHGGADEAGVGGGDESGQNYELSNCLVSVWINFGVRRVYLECHVASVGIE